MRYRWPEARGRPKDTARETREANRPTGSGSSPLRALYNKRWKQAGNGGAGEGVSGKDMSHDEFELAGS